MPADLPSLRLAGSVPEAEVLAVPTRPGDDGPEVLGTVPAELASVLERDKAKGEPGELVAVPTADKVLLLFGDGRWRFGDAATILSDANLSELYEVPVGELAWQGQRVFVSA